MGNGAREGRRAAGARWVRRLDPCRCALLIFAVRWCAGSHSPKPDELATAASTTASAEATRPMPAPLPSDGVRDAGDALELGDQVASAAPSAARSPPPPSPPTTAHTSTPVAVTTAAPAPFTQRAAITALETAGGDLSSCKRPGGPTAPGTIHATFGKTGAVTRITVGPPYADTPQGACVLNRFGGAQMGPIRGTPGSVNYVFHLPK